MPRIGRGYIRFRSTPKSLFRLFRRPVTELRFIEMSPPTE